MVLRVSISLPPSPIRSVGCVSIGALGALGIVIVAVLNSWSGDPNIPATSESAACSVSLEQTLLLFGNPCTPYSVAGLLSQAEEPLLGGLEACGGAGRRKPL